MLLHITSYLIQHHVVVVIVIIARVQMSMFVDVSVPEHAIVLVQKRIIMGVVQPKIYTENPEFKIRVIIVTFSSLHIFKYYSKTFSIIYRSDYHL